MRFLLGGKILLPPVEDLVHVFSILNALHTLDVEYLVVFCQSHKTHSFHLFESSEARETEKG